VKPVQIHENYTNPKSVVPSHHLEKVEAARKYPPSASSSQDSLYLSAPLSQIKNVKGEPLDEGYIAPKKHQELISTQSLQKFELNGLSHIVQYIPYNPDYLEHIYGNSVVSISHSVLL
jgi:hypothetical protein